jgi:hypothetical protein
MRGERACSWSAAGSAWAPTGAVMSIDRDLICWTSAWRVVVRCRPIPAVHEQRASSGVRKSRGERPPFRKNTHLIET